VIRVVECFASWYAGLWRLKGRELRQFRAAWFSFVWFMVLILKRKSCCRLALRIDAILAVGFEYSGAWHEIFSLRVMDDERLTG
jgi:hypothetical protein